MTTAHTASRPERSRRRRGAVPSESQPAVPQVLRRPQGSDVRVRIRGIGSMAVGSVEAIGPDAVGFARGDRVIFPLNREERVGLDAPDAPGGVESLVVDSERLIGVPRDVGDEQAARLLAPGLVTRVLFRRFGPLGAGDRVRVDLSPGTVRAVVVAWLRALGATVAEDGGPVDAAFDEDALRQAHTTAFRRGHLQVGSAEVFAAIRDGVFDDVLDEPTAGRRAAA